MRSIQIVLTSKNVVTLIVEWVFWFETRRHTHLRDQTLASVLAYINPSKHTHILQLPLLLLNWIFCWMATFMSVCRETQNCINKRTRVCWVTPALPCQHTQTCSSKCSHSQTWGRCDNEGQELLMPCVAVGGNVVLHVCTATSTTRDESKVRDVQCKEPTSNSNKLNKNLCWDVQKI